MWVWGLRKSCANNVSRKIESGFARRRRDDEKLSQRVTAPSPIAEIANIARVARPSLSDEKLRSQPRCRPREIQTSDLKPDSSTPKI
jgi:hypothetical protein